MWTKWKALPGLAKIVILILILVGCYQAARNEARGNGPHYPDRETGTVPDGDEEGKLRSASNGEEARGMGGRPVAAGKDGGQALAQFQSEQAQLMNRVRQCQAEMTQATQQMAQAAMQGMLVNNRPGCEQAMPQWIAQEAYLETEIYRLQSGDMHSSVREITGIQAPSYPGGGREAEGGSRRGDSTDAVEEWDRGAIRGTSMYADEAGERHELATENYYYRDRTSGRIVGSDRGDPPNDGGDYERFTAAPHD